MDIKSADTSRSSHPPKPGLVLRVGFAGARNGFDADLAGLRERFTHLLFEIKDILDDIHRNDTENFARDKKPRLAFICALASGADQFAAQIALCAGYELQVPLAMPRNKYAELNFKDDQRSLEAFKCLMAQATSIFELPGAATEEESYDVSGTVLINHTDVLIAIWDLSEGNGRGGTSDSVEKAKANDIPVVVLSSKEPGAETIWYRGRADIRSAELRDIIPAILHEGLQTDTSNAWRSWDRDSLDAKQCKYLHAYYKEREFRMDWGFFYALLISLFRWEWNVRMRRAKYQDQAKENWAKLDGEKWTDKAREFFRPRDQWADCLALFYGQWMRGLVAFSVVGGGLFVSTALAAKLWPDSLKLHHVEWLEVIPYLILILIIVARLKRIHGRWLDYRMLSELLRNHALCAPIGGLHKDRHRFHMRYGFAPTWMRFYYQAVVREFGLCPAVLDDEYLRDYKHLLAKRIKGQIQYHQKQYSKCQTIDRRIRRLGVITAGMSLLSPILSKWPSWSQYLHLPFAGVRLGGIDSIPFIFAVITASVAGFAAQENFPRLAQVSSAIGRRLDLLWREASGAALDVEQLRTVAGEVIDITIQEHAGWNALASLREIEFTS
ncbi:MAG: hypothetical protein WBE76_06640 [Terracidiphilus sp.]